MRSSSLRSPLYSGRLDSTQDGVVYELLIERFLKQLDWHKMLTYLWLECAVYVVGNSKVKAHIMEVRDVTRVPDSVARDAPLSSGVILTVYTTSCA
jgi:membrane protein required for beta-lactamase induction